MSTSALLARPKRFRLPTTAVDSATLLFGQSVRLATQFLVAVAGAAHLGLDQFGLIAATAALARFLVPLAELGGRVLYLRAPDARSDELWRWIVASRTMVALAMGVGVGAVASAALDIGWVDGVWLGTGTLAPLVLLGLLKARHLKQGEARVARNYELLRALSGLLPLLGFVNGNESLGQWARLVGFGGLLFVVASLGFSLRGAGLGMFADGSGLASALEWRAGIAIALALTAQAGSMLLDQFLLGVLSSPGDAAVYSLAATAAFASVMPLGALNEVMSPRLLREDSTPRLRRGFNAAVLGFMALGAVGSVSLWLLVNALFGLEDVERLLTLTVLVIVVLGPRMLSLPFLMEFHRKNRDRDRAVIDVSSLVTNVLLNLLLIERFGVWGALVATAAGEAVFVALVFAARRRLRHGGGGAV